MSQISTANRSSHLKEPGIKRRIVLIIMLSMTLIGALRWAMNVTNANARQVSANIANIQNQYRADATSADYRDSGSDPEPIVHRTASKSGPGPSIDPVEPGGK